MKIMNGKLSLDYFMVCVSAMMFAYPLGVVISLAHYTITTAGGL